MTGSSYAQTWTLHGKITNTRFQPLDLVSVQVQGQTKGTLTNETGDYKLRLEQGKYVLLVSMVGYQSQTMEITLNADQTQDIIINEEQAKELNPVEFKVKPKDRSEEIIRQIIQQKEKVLSASGSYSATVYIKAVQDDNLKRARQKGTADTSEAPSSIASLQQMAMAEIAIQADVDALGRMHEARTGVAERGNAENLFFRSLTDGDFNLYNNQISSRVLSQVPFVGPVSNNGLIAYKYKMLGSKRINGVKYYTIAFIPRAMSNATLTGELTVMDSSWQIIKARFTLPAYHVPEYDFFEVKQQYGMVHDTAWMMMRQEFNYTSKVGKKKLSGQTIALYSNIHINQQFPAKHFGTELSATTENAYERDSVFWQQTRTEQLTAREIGFMRYKDSIYTATHTNAYLDSMESVTNKVTWKKILYAGQPVYSRKKESKWMLPSLVSVIQPFQFGGARINPWFNYNKTYRSRKTLSVNLNMSYGFRNHDFNGKALVTHMYNPFNRGFYRIEATRDFSYIFEGDAWINKLARSNRYLNQSLGVTHGLELLNGLFLFTELDMALRKSLSQYQTVPIADDWYENFVPENKAPDFEPYNALYGKVRLQYTPRQKYKREPREKIILGSKWPTFYTTWRTGIPNVLGSQANFNYLELGMEQAVKLGTAGVLQYNVKTGNFLSQKNLQLIDYQYQRRGDPFLLMNPQEAFQALDSSFPVFKQFWQAHAMQDFNGALLNKIPLLKKLQLREVAGAGFLIAPERQLRYVEFFTGIERIIDLGMPALPKIKFGVYVVASDANLFKNPVMFKVGFTTWDRFRGKWQ